MPLKDCWRDRRGLKGIQYVLGKLELRKLVVFKAWNVLMMSRCESLPCSLWWFPAYRRWYPIVFCWHYWFYNYLRDTQYKKNIKLKMFIPPTLYYWPMLISYVMSIGFCCWLRFLLAEMCSTWFRPTGCELDRWISLHPTLRLASDTPGPGHPSADCGSLLGLHGLVDAAGYRLHPTSTTPLPVPTVLSGDLEKPQFFDKLPGGFFQFPGPSHQQTSQKLSGLELVPNGVGNSWLVPISTVMRKHQWARKYPSFNQHSLQYQQVMPHLEIGTQLRASPSVWKDDRTSGFDF